MSRAFVFDEARVREVPKFDNLMDKATYWKKMADGYRSKLELQLQTQGTNQTFEAEMEAKLAEYEDRIRTLLSSKDKLESENDDLLRQLEETMKHTFQHINQLSDENSRLKQTEEEMSDLIKELETKNAGLESRKSVTYDLLDSYKGSLEEALEKNEYLEISLKDKELEIDRLKRVRDEVRDLKGALAITVRDKVHLKQSKQEYEEAQAYEKFMNMVEMKNAERKAESTREEQLLRSKEENEQQGPARKSAVTSKFGNYKNYIQSMVLGFSLSQESTRIEECELPCRRNKYNPAPGNSNGYHSVHEECVKGKSPVGLSGHYVDMVNNLSTSERVAYSIKQKKKVNKLI